MNDAIPAFIATMASAGIVPLESISSALASGELIRFRAEGDKPGRRNGWAILHLDGTPAGCFGHYRLGVRATWRSGETRDLSRADRQAIARRIAEAEAKRRAETERATHAAGEAWAAASRNVGAHPYLVGKELAAFGVRQLDADLLVPMVDQGFRLWNVQRIAPDGTKRFIKGGRTSGLFWPHGVYRLDGKPSVGPLVIAEGYATAAAIHEATGHSVVAAMSAKNLMAVATIMRCLFPGRELIIAADNDRHLPNNIGLDSAREAAERVGAVVTLPPGAAGAGNDSEEPGIDFADISRAETAALIGLARKGEAVAHG